jgi:HK97 gp10 family phage protein
MSVEINVETRGVEEFQMKMEHANFYIQREIHRGLEQVGMEMHMTARHLAPVKTGRLRDSIYSRVEDWLLKLGATVPYAQFQEFGTRHFLGRFFLTEAVNLNLPRLIQVMNYGIMMAIKTAARE